MKTPLSAASLLSSLVTACFLLSGCSAKEDSSGSVPPAKDAPPAARGAASAEKTSFAEVTAQLDAGGSIYGYLSTAPWLDGLAKQVGSWRELVLSLPSMPASERDQIGRVFDLVGGLVQKSGLESISGVGFSGFALEPGYYRSKFVVHHYPGAGQGYLWTLFGKEAHPLDFADWLPTNTVWAASMDLDVAGLWKAVREHVQQAGIPEASAGLDQFTQMAEQASGMKMDELLGSLGGQFAIALTLDSSKLIPIPLPDGQSLQVPEPGLIVAMKVRDERWFEWTDRTLAANPQVIQGDNKDLGLRMRTMPLPLPVPIELRPSVARAGDWLWVTSHDQLMLKVAQIKSGGPKIPGLRSTAEFKKLTSGLPGQGNQFTFASESLQELVRIVQRAAMQASAGQSDGPPAALMEKLFASAGKIASASVGVSGPEGWLTVGHGHQQPADAVLLPAVVAPVAIMAGITLPALAKAKNKSKSIVCVNNLKQLGLGARIYATDHADKLPPDILSMKAELVTPRILFCPDDPKAAQAQQQTWETVRAENISYEYLGAGKDDGVDPQATMFRCRFHGHVCRMDGSVQQSVAGRP